MQPAMKRFVGSSLALLLAVTLFVPPAHADYLPKNDPKSNHASNIMLAYLGYYDPNDYDGERMGDYDKEKFLPYVAYLNDKGLPQDYFFDSFIMLTTKSPYGGSLSRWYAWVPNSTPGTLKDWQWAMDRVFEKNLQLDALDQAVQQVSSQLGDKDKKVNVYLTLPFPDPASKDFGDFNGDGKSENLESLEVRNELVKWYVDTMIDRFNRQHYKHLTLSGFYWSQEDLDTTVPGEKENVKYAADYLNAQGMRLGWIPWSGAGEKANGNKYGFDFTLIQPNHYFQTDTTIQRIEETAKMAKDNGEGVEVEFDRRALENPYYRQALYDYLIAGVKYEYMTNSLLAYYQDVYAIYDLYRNPSPVGRKLYNDIYKFSKGQFVPPVGNFEGRVLDADGRPLAGAKVESADGFSAVTDAQGKFASHGLPAVRHDFTVGKEGYGTRSVSVDIAAGQTIRQDIMLKQIGGKVRDQYTLADFEGTFNVGGNDAVSRSFTTDKQYVASGEQSLQVYFPKGWGPVMAFIDSGSDKLLGSDRAYVNYTLTDWSAYDTVSMEVYNPTPAQQTLKLVFMYDSYSWGTSKAKEVTLEPGKWKHVEIPVTELRDAGVDVHNVIRLALTMMDPFPTDGATLYFDDIVLRKYEGYVPAPDYRVDLPSSVPTMDVGAAWTVQVKNWAVTDGQGQPTVVADAEFESTDPNVLVVTADGRVRAVSAGTAAIRATIGGIEAQSAVVEVSPWAFNEFKGGKSDLYPGKETTLILKNSFANGYLIPWKEAQYTWTVQGDAVALSDEFEADGTPIANVKTLRGVKKGKATVTVKVTYNGKTKTFERIVKVRDKDSRPEITNDERESKQ